MKIFKNYIFSNFFKTKRATDMIPSENDSVFHSTSEIIKIYLVKISKNIKSD